MQGASKKVNTRSYLAVEAAEGQERSFPQILRRKEERTGRKEWIANRKPTKEEEGSSAPGKSIKRTRENRETTGGGVEGWGERENSSEYRQEGREKTVVKAKKRRT